MSKFSEQHNGTNIGSTLGTAPNTFVCDIPKLQSNNVMDYNANQEAWTPCQLDRVNAQLKLMPYVVVNRCNDCTKDPNYNITITQDQNTQKIDLNGIALGFYLVELGANNQTINVQKLNVLK